MRLQAEKSVGAEAPPTTAMIWQA
ncbi:DUF6053 domain-containing protein [Xanthomonas translucens]